MRTGIYAVLDLVAQIIIGNAPGGLMLHKHPAAAVRMFTDALSDPQMIFNKHPEDFNLVLLGHLNDDNTLDALPELEVVLAGKQWKLSQEPPPLQDPEVHQPRKSSRYDTVRSVSGPRDPNGR